MGVELELRGTPTQVKERKVVVDITLAADGAMCATGTVIAVLAPNSMSKQRAPPVSYTHLTLPTICSV